MFFDLVGSDGHNFPGDFDDAEQMAETLRDVRSLPTADPLQSLSYATVSIAIASRLFCNPNLMIHDTVGGAFEFAVASQNEPNLDLTVEESQQRIANVMQLAHASVKGVVQVRSAVRHTADAALPSSYILTGVARCFGSPDASNLVVTFAPKAQSSAQTTEAAAAVLGVRAANNGAASNGGVSASAAAGSAVSVEPGHRQQVAEAARIATPAEPRAAGLADPGASSRMSPNGHLPPAAWSQSPQSGELPEATQLSAHAGAVKAEPIVAAAGPVLADAMPEAAVPACPVELLHGASVPHASIEDERRKDRQVFFPSPPSGHGVPAAASGEPGDSVAAVAADTADVAAVGQKHSSPHSPKGRITTDQVSGNEASVQPSTAAVPSCEQQAGVQRAVDQTSSGAQPGPSGLPAEDLALMRQLVAQLTSSQPASQTPAAHHGASASQPQQQATSAEATRMTANALAPAAAQQPGMPVDPRPARMHALAWTLPRQLEQEPAAGAGSARTGSVQAGMRSAHTFSATRPLAGPPAKPNAQAVEASAAPSAGEVRISQQDKLNPSSRAPAELPSGKRTGLAPHEDVGVPGLEPSLDGDVPKSETLPTTTRIWRVPTNVRLPNPGLLGWAPPWPQSPTAEGGASGVSPPATAGPSVPAAEAGPLPGTGTVSAAGRAPTAAPAHAEGPAGHPKAASAADIAVEAWLRELSPTARKDVETVRELVLPLKKLRLLADIDAHLYKFSKSECRGAPRVCCQRGQRVPDRHPSSPDGPALAACDPTRTAARASAAARGGLYPSIRHALTL